VLNFAPIMRRIEPSHKLFSSNSSTTLAELKVTYRNLIKEWHPDKVVGDEEKRAINEAQSVKIIAAYEFLVSIHPETHAKNEEAYKSLITRAFITDMDHKKDNLVLTFDDGSIYEYLGVAKSIYIKLVNAPKIARFAKRHIFGLYKYRNVGKPTAVPVSL
jgi:molecular chaperone HscB